MLHWPNQIFHMNLFMDGLKTKMCETIYQDNIDGQKLIHCVKYKKLIFDI